MKRILICLLFILTVLPNGLSAQSKYNYQRRALFELLGVSPRSIVFLGDSITDGGEWSELFGNAACLNRGISGDRSDWMLERIDAVAAGRPRKIFMMIGINDLAQGRTPDQIASAVRQIVARVRELSPRTRIYIQSVLPVNGKSFDSFRGHYAHAAEIPATNALLKALCQEEQVTWIDLYTAMADDEGNLRAEYTNDGLHLLGAGYAVWKKQIEAYVR